MLTRMVVRNFKRFGEVEIELGNPVVFVGPNNSGKTTALQALALWDVGLRRWVERRGNPPATNGQKSPPKERPGVTINRRDLISVPVPDANLLWRNLHVRDVQRENGKQTTKNVRIEILVEGVTDGVAWQCGLEFDYANAESLYCRPLRLGDGESPERMVIPPEAVTRVAFLPPMSGLADREFMKQAGELNFLIGQGRTAEVLRNLCLQIQEDRWATLCQRIERLFGAKLDPPRYLPELSEIEMTYRDAHNVRLDLSSAGRGMQQTLLLLAYLTINPQSVLLLDEPDAHLEILRQRQIYQVLTEVAQEQGSQIIAASHSEIILNEAAERDVVVAFLGKPHRIDNRGHQLLKSLNEIGFEDYFQAEQTGWVLYLEGSTDLAILRVFAAKRNHPAQELLERPFAHYVYNQPAKVKSHFYGLREAKPNLVGFALFDRLSYSPESQPFLTQRMWQRREIENYLCTRETLLAWAASQGEHREGPLFASSWVLTMEETIQEIEQAAETLGRGSPWGPDIKATDDFLNPLFQRFFHKLQLPNLLNKTNYHDLARHLTPKDLPTEVEEVLDALVAIAHQAKPL